MDWGSLLTVASTLIGVLLGGFTTNRGQNKILQTQISWEREKTYKEQHDSRLKAYSKVLEIDGKETFISEPHGLTLEFDFIGYQEKVRPVFYEEFYFLHKDVTELIREIDDIIQQIQFDEDMTSEQETLVCKLYRRLIKMIEEHLKENSESITKIEKSFY